MQLHNTWRGDGEGLQVYLVYTGHFTKTLGRKITFVILTSK